MIVDSQYFFQSAGNIIPLNSWLPENIIEEVDTLNADTSKHLRWREDNDNDDGNDDHGGYKGGIEYKEVPEGWGIPSHATTLGSLLYNKGDMLYPHRDKWKNLDRFMDENGEIPDERGNGMRLINFINHTDSTKFHFVVDGEIFAPEPRRWYAINTQLVHYGFSFTDNVYHISCDLKFNNKDRMASIKYLLDNMEFGQDPDDRKGIDCARN